MKRLAAITIFLGSFLSFGVQPLVGRTLLPAFGGMASVWVTCLAAFQVLLLAGYWYAHLLGSTGRQDPAKQRKFLAVHVVALTLGAGWIAAVAAWHREMVGWAAGMGMPALGALAAVAVLVGVPYLLLSANASTVQVLAGGNYRLYAVSNAGSFAGLLAYPLVFELFLSVQAQWLLLAGLTVVYAGMLWALALRQRAGRPLSQCEGTATGKMPVVPGEGTATGGTPVVPVWVLWLVLPAAGCFLLNAVTAHLTSNVAPIPLMWVVLLGLYLLSYVVGFSAWGERLLPLWLVLGYASVMASAWVIAVGRDSVVRFRWNIMLVPACLFFCCTALHAWLCRARPDAGRLTRYNLCLAVGGAVGGVASSVVAPLTTSWPMEYPVALVVAAGLCVAGMRREAVRLLKDGGPRLWPWAAVCAVLALVAVREKQERQGILSEGRSFYGAWRVGKDTVTNQYGKKYEMYTFKHGGTMHGYEPVNELYREGDGTSYYGPKTAGMLFEMARGGDTNRTLSAGIIGLGIGTMACYGRPGDRIRFYEICPQVADVAKNGPWFDFMRNSAAEVEVAPGDARKSLEAELAAGEERYDVLTVDAYSGDSIPMHLVTREAFELYAARLKAGGVLALHISNWNIDLLPVVKAAAKHLGWEIDVVATRGEIFTLPATWAFVSEKKLVFPAGTYRLNMWEVRDAELPSDAKGSLLPFVNWGLD